MGIKSTLGALATATLLTVASPTTGLSQTTAKAQTSINNCLNSEPLIKKMYDEIIMKKENYRKQKEGWVDELCNIMAAARKNYSKQELDFLVSEGIKILTLEGNEISFTVLLAILDKNGTTESGRDAKKFCMEEGSIYKKPYDEFKKFFEIAILSDNLENKLKQAQNK